MPTQLAHTALLVDDYDSAIAYFTQAVRLETPRSEAYGRVVVFEDRWGNRWDLIEPVAVDAMAAPA